MEKFLKSYQAVRAGLPAFYEQKRGLIEVSGGEAVQFLNGLITNDVAKLESGAEMLAAFPNVQGRLLAVVRVLKNNDKFLFETEEATHEKVFQNLFRFTFAGDFLVEDRSEQFRFFRLLNNKIQFTNNEFLTFGTDVFVLKEAAEDLLNELKDQKAFEMSDELFEVWRIEQGIPLYGADIDETTIVPEIGWPDLISYQKGCYIGQEIIARIHFRGHIAKQLTGLILSERLSVTSDELKKAELKSLDGKNAGRLTSHIFSPKLEKTIALGYVRYDYLAEGTELKLGESTATVKNLPFIE